MIRWQYHVPILKYHRVGPFKGDHVPTVSAEAFERQLAFLVRHRYRVLSLDELIGFLERGERIPRRSVVITFDDGYEETYTVAWPLLQHVGFPMTVFVTPGEIGLPGFATWDQVLEMSRDAVTIGSHTMHHSYVPLMGEEQLTEELVGSKRLLEERIGQTVGYLSYPVGGFTPQAQAIAKQAGYRAACTTNRAAASATAIDRYALRRIKITERDAHPFLFWFKLSGYYDAFRELKAPA